MSNYYPKISFITVCKGRLHHLCETLPKNILWNMNYPNIEFVLLDYNSKDGLEDWVKQYMGGIIERGILVYYKNPEPEYFHFTHSRNQAIKLATGDIVCNLDADNYTGEGFAYYLADKLSNVDVLVGASLINKSFVPMFLEQHLAGTFGRIALKREVIINVGGYFEGLEHWGDEDIDLYLRLVNLGYSFDSIEIRFLHCIDHSNEERGAQTKISQVGLGSSSHSENKNIHKNNIANKNFIVNNGIFGKGSVFKNFGTELIQID